MASLTWQICALCVFSYNLFMLVMKYIPLVFNCSAPQSWWSSEREEHPHLRAFQSTAVWNLEGLCFSSFFFFFFFNLAGISIGSKHRWISPIAAQLSYSMSRFLYHPGPTRKTVRGVVSPVPTLRSISAKKHTERTEKERSSLSRDVWGSLVLKTSNAPATFVVCICLLACTSGIPQSQPPGKQHGWHRCSWKMYSFPVAPSRV